MKLELTIDIDNKDIVNAIMHKYGSAIIDCIRHGETFMTFHFVEFPYCWRRYNGFRTETRVKFDTLVYVDNDPSTGLSVSLDTIYITDDFLFRLHDEETRQEIGRMLTKRIEELWDNED